MNDVIKVVAQAVYGNRVETEIDKNNVDRFILGYLDNSISVSEEIDRTIVGIPNEDNIVIVYNKHEEEKELRRAEELSMKPLVVIAEKNIEIYSRCIVCRIDSNGELASLQNGDYEKFVKYLAE